MDPAKPIEAGSDARKNWLSINQNSASLDEVRRELWALKERFEAHLRGKDINDDGLPFRVFSKPNSRRTVDDAAWWRKFYVRHGYVNKVKTTKCVDSDGEGTTPEEITVPESTASYKVWVEVDLTGSTVTAAEMKHGTAGWTGYPVPTGSGKFYILLAIVTTLTAIDDNRVTVRQFQLGDATIAGVGSGGLSVWRP